MLNKLRPLQHGSKQNSFQTMLHEFGLSHRERNVCQNLCAMYDDIVVAELTCQQWFRCFRSEEKRFVDQPCSASPNEFESHCGDDKLTVTDLSERYNIPCTTIARRVLFSDYVLKFDSYVPLRKTA